MADEQNDSKGSDATKIILALIGLAGTVATGWFGYATVTHKNGDSSTEREVVRDDQPVVENERNIAGDDSTDGRNSESNLVDDEQEVIEPPNPPKETFSVAGDWIAPTGTGGMTIEQQGKNLQVSILVLVEGQLVPFVGSGTIDGRKLSWNTSTVDNMGISYEYACSGRLTTSNNSIQGKCDGYGGQTDVYVNRM